MKGLGRIPLAAAAVALIALAACDATSLMQDIPVPPAGLAMGTVTSNSIAMTWTASEGADSYAVYRSDSASGPFTKVGSLTQAAFTDTGLAAETTYHYQVAASNEEGESDPCAAQPSTTVARQWVDYEFALTSYFNFGNSTNGYYPATSLYVTGDFNGWDDGEGMIELPLDEGDGFFRGTVNLERWTKVKFKYLVSTTAVPTPTWWGTMDNCYEGLGQEPGTSPAASIVTFESDGYQGMNAVFTVP